MQPIVLDFYHSPCTPMQREVPGKAHNSRERSINTALAQLDKMLALRRPRFRNALSENDLLYSLRPEVAGSAARA